MPAQAAEAGAQVEAQKAAPQTGLAFPGLPSISVFTGAQLPVGSPTDVYTRVARGALTCWFGASGPLKGPYIYHAEAAPPSKGGRAEIIIRTRDVTASDPRSLKAFQVVMSAGSEGTHVDIKNAKIPEPLATRLTADVRRWASDVEGCGEAPVTAGWSPAAAAQNAAPGKEKGSQKPAAKKAMPVKDQAAPVR